MSKTTLEWIESLENLEISTVPRETKNEICPYDLHDSNFYV